MSRVMIIAVLLLSAPLQRSVADEPAEGKCLIINTTSAPIAIGIYRPSSSGIDERIIFVAAKTQLSQVPIKMVAGAQFIVAYKAELNGEKIERSEPIDILGHRSVRFVRNAKDTKTPDVLIHFRGGSQYGRRDVFNTAIYIPDTETEALRVIKDANHTQKLVRTRLTQQKFETN